MPRPINERKIRIGIAPRVMKPSGIPAKDLNHVILGFDEAEAIRLADLEGLYQEAAARSMGVSRQTFGRIIETARRKVADALLNGKALRIEGGEISIKKQEESIVKIAVATKGGEVDEHFGRCREFLVFRVDGSALVGEPTIVPAEGIGCKSGIASELARVGVTHLIAGNMGTGAQRVLNANGISIVRGASGNAESAALALLNGTLKDSEARCEGSVHDCAQRTEPLTPEALCPPSSS
ncbi:MAG: DUF134 domain-containing protein [Treponema sp.]|nr:DUF134 domain-containing protein [Treponema sp.]